MSSEETRRFAPPRLFATVESIDVSDGRIRIVFDAALTDLEWDGEHDLYSAIQEAKRMIATASRAS